MRPAVAVVAGNSDIAMPAQASCRSWEASGVVEYLQPPWGLVRGPGRPGVLGRRPRGRSLRLGVRGR